MYSILHLGSEKIGEVEFIYPNEINFARYINKASGTQRLAITNSTNEDLSEVRISISGDMFVEHTVTLPRIPANTTVGVKNVRVEPIFSKLAELTEGITTEFTFTISVGNELVLQEICSVHLMAYNHWLNTSKDRHFLASFVMPNHPAVTTIVKRAAQILSATHTGACFIGYPSDTHDEKTVHQAVTAIWLALKELHLHYVPVPMTMDAGGQRIRLAPDIIAEGLGNCIDLSILLCSCLEAVSLCPCIVMIEGHAFVAVNKQHSTMLPPLDIATWRTSNTYIPIEATLLCDESKTLSDAINEGEYTILNSKIEDVLDITRLRNKISPLPLAASNYAELIAPENAPRLQQQPQLTNRMELWERKLLDLTMRNSLVNMHHSKNLMPIAQKSIKDILSALDNDKLHNLAEERKGFGTMKILYQLAKQSLEETGGNTLFLTIGTLRWYEPDNRDPHFAPLMLIPIEIERHSAKRYIIHRMDNEPMPNITLMECLRQKCDIQVPDLSDLPKDENGNIDFEATLDLLRKSFDDMPDWQIVDEAMLGIFSFTKFVIWNDLHTHRDLIGEHPMVKSLLDGVSTVTEMLPETDDMLATQLAVPVPADNSQLQAIHAADKGQSFVLFGPPGTGKSQTITAMIACALNKGKTVLFVSEKKAALEVVQNRLENIGLGDFCLELHSNKVGKNHFLSQMERVLTVQDHDKNASFDILKGSIETTRHHLDATTSALHKVRAYGRSLYDDIEGYLSTSAHTIDIPYAVAATLDEDKLNKLCEQFTQLDTIAAIVGCHPSRHPLCQILPYENTSTNQQQVEETIVHLGEAIETAKMKANDWLNRWFIHRTPEQILQRTDLWKMLNDNAYVKSDIGNNLSNLQEAATQWQQNLSTLRLWYHFSVPANILRRSGTALAFAYYMEGHSGVDTAAAFRHSVYKARVMHILTNENILRQFNGAMFEQEIIKLRDEQRQFMELAKQETLHHLTCNATNLNPTELIEQTYLKRRIASRGHGTSIRTILKNTSHIIPHLAPCMLMSPLSVSQFLQMQSAKFDLVIFDEASQLPTCEAIGAIARGKNLVVVGDPQQMPPTDFFNANIASDGFSETEDLESVLDDCMAISMPTQQLNVHYRSNHESLIAFSNMQFYDGKLTTFPSSDNERSRVEFRLIKGVYDFGHTRTNRIEAEALVDELIEHLQAQNDGEEEPMSIGVIAFNKKQSMLIEEILTQRLAGKRNLERLAFESEEPVFIKNLENVQGDERDIILFSVGYGPDSKGRVSMNFGPLNLDGGHRRLNVAVTRAREYMKVFSSMLPSDIDLTRTDARGVEALRNFLMYAQTGKLTIPANQISSIEMDAITKDIVRRLTEKGYECSTEVGSSQFKVDIAVKSPTEKESYLLGILIDGHTYAKASIDDREMVRPEILRRLGWQVYRLWAIDWVNQPQKVMNDIMRLLMK